MLLYYNYPPRRDVKIRPSRRPAVIIMRLKSLSRWKNCGVLGRKLQWVCSRLSYVCLRKQSSFSAVKRKARDALSNRPIAVVRLLFQVDCPPYRSGRTFCHSGWYLHFQVCQDIIKKPGKFMSGSFHVEVFLAAILVKSPLR